MPRGYKLGAKSSRIQKIFNPPGMERGAQIAMFGVGEEPAVPAAEENVGKNSTINPLDALSNAIQAARPKPGEQVDPHGGNNVVSRPPVSRSLDAMVTPALAPRILGFGLGDAVANPVGYASVGEVVATISPHSVAIPPSQ